MDSCNIKNVLVTGATGYIGTALCAYLFSAGFCVRALTRKNLDVVNKDNKYHWVCGDITKPETLKNSCDGIDIVIHLAGFAHAYEEENKSFQSLHDQTNYQGTVHIVNESIRAGVKRFIYFSSVKACAERAICSDETWEAMPIDAYGLAKRKAEEAVLSLCEGNGITPIILRPTLVYGAGVKGNLSAIIKAISKGYFPSPPPIQNKKSMVSLNDLCLATLLAMRAENPRSKIYIVTDGIFYSTSEIVKMMRAALGKKQSAYYLPLWAWHGLARIGDFAQLLIRKRLPLNTQAVKKLFSNAAYTSQMIKNELQFEPEFSLQDALPLMIRAAKDKC